MVRFPQIANVLQWNLIYVNGTVDLPVGEISAHCYVAVNKVKLCATIGSVEKPHRHLLSGARRVETSASKRIYVLESVGEKTVNTISQSARENQDFCTFESLY